MHKEISEDVTMCEITKHIALFCVFGFTVSSIVCGTIYLFFHFNK
jgi:hypothetical protein